ncbi:cytoplasmic tyrosine-protein kinase BMX [Ambystoma mexicanum]|uniref:cytoplasmic tyrosine-protein kinase BMX n=1 Tax=Ambystoma mexicanum TaxID=8296 RepID=UPI0037E83B28
MGDGYNPPWLSSNRVMRAMNLLRHNKIQEETILEEVLLKRSQQKKKTSSVNYKQRLFVLTKDKLSYYKFSKQKKGNRKGYIDVKHIQCVETVNLVVQTPIVRQYPFQIVYKDGFLYVYSANEESRRKWLRTLQQEITGNADLLNTYHSGFFANGAFQCCNRKCKTAAGCTTWEKYPARQRSSRGVKSLPPVPANTPLTTHLKPDMRNSSLKITVDGQNYKQEGKSGSRLIKDITCHIVAEEHPDSSKVSDSSRKEACCNTIGEEEGLENSEWYMGNISRAQAEQLLHQKGKEGCFMVRKSSKAGMYTVSVYSMAIKDKKPTVKHYHVHINSENKVYVAENYCFDSIAELIKYHQHNSAGIITRLRHSVTTKVCKVASTAALENGTWELRRSEIVLLEELGSGQFGMVHRGMWKATFDVAVKMIKEGSMSEDDFIEEAQTMMKLTHPKLVKLYGVCTQKYPIYIVTEYMANGCLLNYLQNNRRLLQPFHLLEMCFSVCEAMAFLESHSFIHRDLAARNCLVGNDLAVKVADFGMTRYVLDDEYVSSVGTKFPVKWSAPEVFNYSNFSSKSDVWAFGILMWEVFSLGKQPYALYDNAEVIQKVSQGYRLYRPQLASGKIHKLMKMCWNEVLDNRPTFHELLSEIELHREEDDHQ